MTNMAIIYFALISMCNAIAVQGQLGSECSQDEDCYQNQVCRFNTCKCIDSYVRNNLHCFRERKYGEHCFFDIQCSDETQICEGEGSSRSCVCKRLYTWDEASKECIHAVDLEAVMALTKEQSNIADQIEIEAQKLFKGIVAAGLLATTVGSLLALGCVVYGCCGVKWLRGKKNSETYVEAGGSLPMTQATPLMTIPKFPPIDQQLEQSAVTSQSSGIHPSTSLDP